MWIVLTAGAAEFVRSRGGHLLVYAARTAAGSGNGAVPEPLVDARRPRGAAGEYETAATAGVAVHQERAVAARPGTLYVSLARFLGWQALTSRYEQDGTL